MGSTQQVWKMKQPVSFWPSYVHNKIFGLTFINGLITETADDSAFMVFSPQMLFGDRDLVTVLWEIAPFSMTP